MVWVHVQGQEQGQVLAPQVQVQVQVQVLAPQVQVQVLALQEQQVWLQA